MGLLNKIFGSKDKAAGPPSVPPSSQFQESEATEHAGSRNAPRRELVQVVLRDTMRKHGIPSDWIDVRILTSLNRRHVTGMHVQLIVRHAHDDLLAYVYAFQESFMSDILKFDPRVDEWLMGIAWQFQGKGSTARAMPDPSTWGAATAAATAATAAAAQAAEEPPDDVEADLRALFAIRDAAIDGMDHVDFQATRPGFEDSVKPRN